MRFSSQWPPWWDRSLKGATPIHGVEDLVILVVNTAVANKRTIDKLIINGHGSDNEFRIGSDWIDGSSIEGFRAFLVKMAPHPTGLSCRRPGRRQASTAPCPTYLMAGCAF